MLMLAGNFLENAGGERVNSFNLYFVHLIKTDTKQPIDNAQDMTAEILSGKMILRLVYSTVISTIRFLSNLLGHSDISQGHVP